MRSSLDNGENELIRNLGDVLDVILLTNILSDFIRIYTLVLNKEP